MKEELPKGPPTLPPGVVLEQRESGLEILDVRSAAGRTIEPSDKVTIRYRLWLTIGTFVESSDEEGISVDLADSGVVLGLREGIVGMKVGAVRRLIVPSDLAYGSKGLPPHIPPYSTLIYDVELLSGE